MRQNLRSSFSAVAAVVAASMAAIEVTPVRKAVVSGGITPCQALPISSTPRYVGGTVTVLQGDVVWKASSGPASLEDVLPKDVVAVETTATDGMYRFALEPGDYVLKAGAAADYGRYATVRLGAGDEIQVDIPNDCL